MGKNLVRQKTSLEAATPQSLPGLSLRAGGRGISTATTPGYFLRKKGKMRPKELTTCSVPHLLTAYTRQLEIFVTALITSLIGSIASCLLGNSEFSIIITFVTGRSFTKEPHKEAQAGLTYLIYFLMTLKFLITMLLLFLNMLMTLQ